MNCSFDARHKVANSKYVKPIKRRMTNAEIEQLTTKNQAQNSRLAILKDEVVALHGELAVLSKSPSRNGRDPCRGAGFV